MKAYIKDPDLMRQSKHHTHYAGDGAIVKPKDGELPKLHKMVFVNGVATDVDEQTFQRFKDLGACDSTPPTIYLP